jgi:hypothetical protein
MLQIVPSSKKPVINDPISGDSGIKTIISFRIASPLIAWLKRTALEEGRSTNAFVAELMEDARSWYGLPYAMVEAFEADRQALKLSRRHYLMHVLLRRYEQIGQHGHGFDRPQAKDSRRR